MYCVLKPTFKGEAVKFTARVSGGSTAVFSSVFYPVKLGVQDSPSGDIGLMLVSSGGQ